MVQNSQELPALCCSRFAISRSDLTPLAAVAHLQAVDDPLVTHHRAALHRSRQRIYRPITAP